MSLSPQHQVLLKEAVTLHQGGRLEQARTLYHQILQMAPPNADLLRFAGTAECQLGNPQAGIGLLSQSLELAPNQPDVYHNRGQALLKLGRMEEAVHSYDRAVALRPTYASAWFNRGMALINLNQFEAAAMSFGRAASVKPDFTEAWLEQGNALMDLDRMAQALACFERVLALRPDSTEALINRSNALINLKRFAEAAESYDKVVKVEPELAYAWSNRGIALMKCGRHAEALASYDRALELEPDLADAWSNRGDSLGGLGRYEEAVASCNEALRLRPGFVKALNIRGNAKLDLHDPEGALHDYDQALALQPAYPEGLCNRAGALLNLKRYAEALESCDRSLALLPDVAETHNNRGSALLGLERFEEALAQFNRALSLKPDSAEMHSNRGNALQGLSRYGEALGSYDRALTFDGDYVDALNNRGNALIQLDLLEEAAASYARALALKPDFAWVAGQILHNQMHLSDWTAFQERLDGVADRLRQGEKAIAPFGLQALIDAPDLHRLSSEAFKDELYPERHDLTPFEPRPEHDRLRIAYVSADFGEHPVTYLLAGMLEQHDRAKFEIFAYSLGKGMGVWRDRVTAAVEHFIDVSEARDADVVAMMRDHQIDIAVDLNGFTKGCRTRIFADRAAPVQVSYIGFLGTMGASYIDYLIADEMVIPQAQRAAYAEKIVYLPIYQMNDDHQQASSRTFTRQELGLPQDGFVFCCFNLNFKITPDVFDSWMRILGRVPGSVLWLYVKSALAVRNLKVEAKVRGIDPDRLIFAPRMPLEDHLARQAMAGLFLDTHPYNAGATASNALQAGLPVLTRMGQSFAARMGASLLMAAGLPELITETPEAYEDLAVQLAQSPDQLMAIRQKLLANLATCALFDTARSTQAIEAAYTVMYDRFRSGLAPDHIHMREP